LSELPENACYYHEVIGFKVIDEKEGYLGTIQSVHEQKEQSLLLVIEGSNEILIPFADEIIIKIDKKDIE